MPMDTMLNPVAWSMQALTEQYETVAHNLANVSTAGYKARVNAFQKVWEQHLGAVDPLGDHTALDKQKAHIDYGQGLLDNTGRSLDVALMGRGFFAVETPDGVRYTRNGTFRIDRQNRLVDGNGRMVAGTNGPITIPPGASEQQIAIASDGTLSAAGREIGRLKLVEFDDESKLTPVGESCFVSDDPTLAKDSQSATVCQGFLERSNVNSVGEMISLIELSRLYEANLKMAKTQDERMQSNIRAAST